IHARAPSPRYAGGTRTDARRHSGHSLFTPMHISPSASLQAARSAVGRLSSHDLSRRLLAPPENLGERLGRAPLPPPRRANARLAVLDVTEFFGETSGGVRTYLMEKAAFIEVRPDLRHVLVVPGGADAITETGGVRCYRLRGPGIPTQRPYRFMLATRTS